MPYPFLFYQKRYVTTDFYWKRKSTENYIWYGLISICNPPPILPIFKKSKSIVLKSLFHNRQRIVVIVILKLPIYSINKICCPRILMKLPINYIIFCCRNILSAANYFGIDHYEFVNRRFWNELDGHFCKHKRHVFL